MFKHRGAIRKTSRLSLGMSEQESAIDVQCRQEDPNPRVGELGKLRFPLERWTLGLGFFCPLWTPMMDSICPKPSENFMINQDYY